MVISFSLKADCLSVEICLHLFSNVGNTGSFFRFLCFIFAVGDRHFTFACDLKKQENGFVKDTFVEFKMWGKATTQQFVCVFTWMLFSEIGSHPFSNELRSVQYLGVMSCETQS